MRKIRTPFFEIGVKNYVYGDAVLEMALQADRAAAEYDLDILFITPYTEIRRVAEQTRHLIVLAPYMDTLSPGRGMADILPEAIVAAGARGVVVNHCEKPLSLPVLRRTIQRAHELDLLVFACAGSVPEAQAVALLGPEIVNPEPEENIGSGQTSDPAFVALSNQAVRRVDPAILVEQAAGVTCGQQVYDLILAGADGVGAASGIFRAADPVAALWDMVSGAARARDELRKQKKELQP